MLISTDSKTVHEKGDFEHVMRGENVSHLMGQISTQQNGTKERGDGIENGRRARYSFGGLQR